MKKRQRFITTCALITVALAAPATNLTVPGSSSPWLAGMPDGSVGACGLDSAPAASPVLATGFALGSGFVLTFSASGGVWYEASEQRHGPDGGVLMSSPACGSQNGMADVTTPSDALLGVFLDDTQPNLSAAPDPLAYTPDAPMVAPGLKQVFLIGDGLTPSGAVQQFIVPAGATRLFLGTADGYGWYNNVGSFSVEVVSRPRLSIVRIGDSQARLSWSTNTAAFSLECVTNLTSSEWMIVTNNPTAVGDEFELAIDLTLDPKYYRLRAP